MKSVLEAINNRFPYRPSIKFVKSHRRLSATYHEGQPDFNNYIEQMYDIIEVPYEIVKKIYEAGWSDAKCAMKEAIDEQGS